MNIRTGKWFEVAVTYDKTREDGLVKKVTEKYVTEAQSFTEAEANIITEMTMLVRGYMLIKNINPQPYREVFFSDKEEDHRFYKVKVAFITLDEKTGMEKLTPTVYLVQASNPTEALRYTKQQLEKAIMDYQLISSVDAKLQDVFEAGKTTIQERTVTITELPDYTGRALAKNVVKKWTEKFKDESTGDVIDVEHGQLIFERLHVLTNDDIRVLTENNISSVVIYENTPKLNV